MLTASELWAFVDPLFYLFFYAIAHLLFSKYLLKTMPRQSLRIPNYKPPAASRANMAAKVARAAGVAAARATQGDSFSRPRSAPYPQPKRARGKRDETKTVDAALSSMRYDNNSAVANTMQLLNTVPTGTSGTTRIGKRVNCKAVHIRGYITAASATTLEAIATILLWIRTPNQAVALPAWTEILATQSAAALTNRDNAPKFKILRRWDHKVV